MKTEKNLISTQRLGANIHINGIVQGVGFRPFVYNLAERMALKGWVCNTSAGVDIQVDGNQQALDTFILALSEEAPPLSKIDEVLVDWITPQDFTSFEIIHSQDDPGGFLPISPDVCICLDCLEELDNPKDRRYRYPFINCTNCGPRFTIIKGIPYDRPFTTMAEFPMCPACKEEYNNPADRRFHAQPVACPECGPKIWLEIDGKKIGQEEDALQAARALLKEGKILAVKGLGGFHLACDATNPEAVAELRRRKLRVDKPFAVMIPDIGTVSKHCKVNPGEKELLESRQRPIVILDRLPNSPIAEATAPGQQTLGVMLPYTPLHYLLLESAPDFPPALVMTSGNLSEEPLTIENEEARHLLSGLADAFLMHDRDIYIRCDDSVVRTITQDDETNIYQFRRSRGYAPFPIRTLWEMPQLLATGGELKNTFCLAKDRYAFISHHIGDLENYETLSAFEMGIKHFEKLFRITPEILAYDLHPNYMSTRYAQQRSQEEGIPAYGIQHHHAHIAACLAENNHHGDRPVIGLAFDGTGYGTDETIWGGEVLLADYKGFQRLFHLLPVRLPGGDSAVKEPRRVALAWLENAGLPWDDEFDSVLAADEERLTILKNQIQSGINAPYTSSMGRLFDAAAALAGVRQTVNYEAQAAIEFEALADPAETGSYPITIAHQILDPRPLFQEMVKDIKGKTPISTISARFHNSIADLAFQVCVESRKQTSAEEVALSGGVWQNMILLKKTIQLLVSGGFTVFIHKEVPTNDGGISLGQAAIAYHTTI